MTQRLDKIKTDKIRDPNSKLVTNGSEAQNENKHSSPDKIGRLRLSSIIYLYTSYQNVYKIIGCQLSIYVMYDTTKLNMIKKITHDALR